MLRCPRSPLRILDLISWVLLVTPLICIPSLRFRVLVNVLGFGFIFFGYVRNFFIKHKRNIFSKNRDIVLFIGNFFKCTPILIEVLKTFLSQGSCDGRDASVASDASVISNSSNFYINLLYKCFVSYDLFLFMILASQSTRYLL